MVQAAGAPSGEMVTAKNWAKVVPGREHHSDWFQSIGHPDAEFIAHARSDIPWLLAEVRRLQGQIAEFREAVDGETAGRIEGRD